MLASSWETILQRSSLERHLPPRPFWNWCSGYRWCFSSFVGRALTLCCHLGSYRFRMAQTPCSFECYSQTSQASCQASTWCLVGREVSIQARYPTKTSARFRVLRVVLYLTCTFGDRKAPRPPPKFHLHRVEDSLAARKNFCEILHAVSFTWFRMSKQSEAITIGCPLNQLDPIETVSHYFALYFRRYPYSSRRRPLPPSPRCRRVTVWRIKKCRV